MKTDETTTDKRPSDPQPPVSLADNRQPTVQAARPIDDHPPRSKKKRLIIAAVIAAVVIVAVVAALYVLVSSKGSESESDADPLAAATRFETPQALIDAVEPELQGTLVEVKVATGVSAIDGDNNYAYGAPVYRPDGADFATLPLAVTGSAYKGDSVAAESNYAALKHFFEANKFVQKYTASNEPGTMSDFGEAVNYVTYAEYESSELLCAIRHADASSTSAGAHIASIGCADKKSYQEAVTTLQPFYKAYTASRSDVSDNLVFGFLREANGANGYKYAVIYQEDDKQFDNSEDITQLTGLYFQAPGKSDWTYFTVTTVDSVLVCSDYDSAMLKDAFKGYECYDEASQKTVTVQ